MLKILSAVLVLALTSSLFAVEKPTGVEVQKVMSYYKNGKGQGAILVDSKLTSGIHKSGENKNEAMDELIATEIRQGDKAFIWMNYLVPASDTANIFIEFKRKGKVKKTADLSIKGTTRYRTWKALPTSKLGEWEIVIYQELDEDNDLELAKFSYSVI